MATIKVMQVGLGPIGQQTVRYSLDRSGIDIVAAVDPAPDIAGRSLADVSSLDHAPPITVAPNVPAAAPAAKADVALLTTVSSFEKCAEQVEELVRLGMHVVSTCEEMSFPWLTHPELARHLNEIARKHNVAVLATGVNPGFLMDFLPVIMTGVCTSVTAVHVSRLQDASLRRIPFQQKVGVGLSPEEFQAKKELGTLRHVGLTESMHMIAQALGWQLDATEDVLSPVIADRRITTGYSVVEPGMAAGVQQIGTAYVHGRAVITLTFRACLDEPTPGDTVEITGTPHIVSAIRNGVNGDVATCAVIVNAVKSIARAEPGLRTMIDFPCICSLGA